MTHILSNLCFATIWAAFAISSVAAEEPAGFLSLSSSSLVLDEPETPAWQAVVGELSERVTTLEQENRWLRDYSGNAFQHAAGFITQNGNNAMQFHGRIHSDIWGYPGDSPGVNAFESGDSTISPQDRLELRRARFSLEGELLADGVYKLDLELSEASQPEFRDVYVGRKNLPIIQTFLFGNQKRPYGLDHLNSSSFNVFMERPFVVQSFNHNNRRFGIMSYGVSDDEAWNWRFGTFNLSELQRTGLYTSDHWQLEMAGRLARTISDSMDESRFVHLAVSSSYAVPDGDPAPGHARNQARFRTEPETRSASNWLDTGTIAGASQYYILGLEGVANLGRFQLTGEYMNLWLDRDSSFGDKVHFHGGYIYLAYFLTDHFQGWNHRLGIIDRVSSAYPDDDDDWDHHGAWQLAVRWSFVDLTDSDIRGGVGQSIALGINYNRTPQWRIQFNCIYGDISDHVPVDGQTSGTYVTIGTRIMVDF